MSLPEPDKNPSSLVGQTIEGRYRVDALLGEGGMGSVYLVEHTLMRKRMALKVLHPEMCGKPDIVARFEREAMAAAHIEHPNVAAATDFGRTPDGAFFLVLEYIEGTSLRDAIRAGLMSAPVAVAIARQIAAALVRAHELGIVHRDLKPDNVMLVQRGEESNVVKVLDFGIAKVNVDLLSRSSPSLPGTALTRVGMIFGTPEYMAPEQALGEEVDPRCDLYSLGVILYEMLTGVVPFAGSEMTQLLGQIITAVPPPMLSRNPAADVPPELDAVVMRLLAKQATARYASAKDLMMALDEAVPPPNPNAAGIAYRLTMPGPLNHTPQASELRARAIGDLSASARTASEPAGVAALRAQVQRIPRKVFAIGAAALGTCVVLALALSLGAGDKKASATAAGAGQVGLVNNHGQKQLADDRLRDATAGGPDALEHLALEYPEDPRVARALVATYTDAKRPADAMRATAQLLKVDPSAASDDSLLRVVTAVAATGHGEGADAAVALLEGSFGESGVDALYDLASRGSSRNRFAQSLAKADVRAHASPAALVALDLKAASSCESKKSILPRAQKYGDARCLPALKTLTATKGCGFLSLGDCNRCLRSDNALHDAMKAVEAR